MNDDKISHVTILLLSDWLKNCSSVTLRQKSFIRLGPALEFAVKWNHFPFIDEKLLSKLPLTPVGVVGLAQPCSVQESRYCWVRSPNASR